MSERVEELEKKYLSLLSFVNKEKSPAPLTSQGPPTSMMPSVLGPRTPTPTQSVLSLNQEPLPVTPPCSLSLSTPNSTGQTEPEPVSTAVAETIVLTPSEPGELLKPDAVINKYPKLMSLANIGRLAVRLACESYFGKDLLKKCTVVGCNDKPALPKHLVLDLKAKLLSIHPQFRTTPVEFEPFWCKCVGAINHCAAGLRAKEHIIKV